MSKIAEVVDWLKRSRHRGFLMSFRRYLSFSVREYLDEKLS
jgi:hypothetical protein